MFCHRLTKYDPLIVRDHSPPTMLSGSGHGLGMKYRWRWLLGERMENVDIKKDEEMKTKTEEKKKNEEIIKITINKESEQKLMELLRDVNDGFTSGRVNRQDLASWMIVKFCRDCDGNTIEKIRADHFDEIMMLETILRKSKETGTLPPEFQSLFKQQMGAACKKKSRKMLTE